MTTTHESTWTAPDRAEAVLQAAIAVTRFAARSPDLDVRPEVRRELIGKYVLWLVTTGTAPSKYATRFQSTAARTCTDPKQLRHEHVFTRKYLVDLILSNPEDSVIDFVIRNLSIGCTVTNDEHTRLSKFDKTHTGWERYEAAGVEVVDMARGTVMDLTPEEVT